MKKKAFLPVSFLILVLLPIILLPLSAIFIYAGRGGIENFVNVLLTKEAQFALRFSLIIATLTTIINGIIGTYSAYVLSKFSFKGNKICLLYTSRCV